MVCFSFCSFRSYLVGINCSELCVFLFSGIMHMIEDCYSIYAQFEHREGGCICGSDGLNICSNGYLLLRASVMNLFFSNSPLLLNIIETNWERIESLMENFVTKMRTFGTEYVSCIHLFCR
jgi:hypothetical protein